MSGVEADIPLTPQTLGSSEVSLPPGPSTPLTSHVFLCQDPAPLPVCPRVKPSYHLFVSPVPDQVPSPVCVSPFPHQAVVTHLSFSITWLMGSLPLLSSACLPAAASVARS